MHQSDRLLQSALHKLQGYLGRFQNAIGRTGPSANNLQAVTFRNDPGDTQSRKWS